MGELLALQWPDIDWQGRFIEVRRNYTHWKVTTPKSGESRQVDMSKELTQTLKDLLLERQIEAGATGTEVPLWVFPSEAGGLLHPHNIRDRVFLWSADESQATEGPVPRSPAHLRFAPPPERRESGLRQRADGPFLDSGDGRSLWPSYPWRE